MLLMFTSSWWLMPTMDFVDLVLSALTSLSVTCVDDMTELTYFLQYFSGGCLDPLRCIYSENALDKEKEFTNLYRRSFDKFCFVIVIVEILCHYRQAPRR